MRRSLRVLSLSAVLAAVAVAVSAGSASAQSTTLTNVDCGGQTYTITLEVGDTLTVHTAASGICDFLGYTSSTSPAVSTTFGPTTGTEYPMPGSAAIAPGWAFVVTALQPGSAQLMTAMSGAMATETQYVITVVPVSAPVEGDSPPTTEHYAVSAHGTVCPNGWTLAGWEAWAQGRVCILATTYNPGTGQWSAGTYAEVMTVVDTWNRTASQR